MISLTTEDRRWLDAAARFATPFAGTTADNPVVAALVVDPGTQTLIARAVTARGGRPHAESQALDAAGLEAAGRTLYVTLEPCHHWGRTPPCVDAIIRSGIMRVVIGALNPDTRSAGDSAARLESAGIEVVLANHAPSAALMAGHALRHAKGRPQVTVVTGALEHPAVLGQLEMLRSRSDAILVSAASARRAGPSDYAVALPGLTSRTPLRVVLSDADGLDRKVNLIGGFSGYRTMIIAENSVSVDAPASVEVLRTGGKAGLPDLAAALIALGKRGIQNVLAEADAGLLNLLAEAGLVDSLVLVEDAADTAENEQVTELGLVETFREFQGGMSIAHFALPPAASGAL